MHIEQFDPAAEPGKVAACYRMYLEGIPFDDPDGPPFPENIFAEWLREGFGGERREVALAVDSGQHPVGFYLLELRQDRNTHIGSLLPVVAPAQRRRGYGTALLSHAAHRAAAHGRTLLSAEPISDAPGSAFAAAMGASVGVLEVRRVLDVTAIPAGHLAALRHRAEQASRGYSLLTWTGPTPEEYRQDMAEVHAAMADAPRNPGEEAHRADPEQGRVYERRAAEMGLRVYTVAARCDRTGELVGLTQIGIDAVDSIWAHQFVTAVTRAHRGHRLGLLLKAAMMEDLMLAEPQVTRVITDNADSNQHMIAINVELGYRVLDAMQCWQLEVAAVAQPHQEHTHA
jgi:GNAT superfamily N-acetyltransferase/RimJ/RimL family protein N-acetyltransferase